MFPVAKHHFVCSIVGEITGNSVDYNLERQQHIQKNYGSNFYVKNFIITSPYISFVWIFQIDFIFLEIFTIFWRFSGKRAIFKSKASRLEENEIVEICSGWFSCDRGCWCGRRRVQMVERKKAGQKPFCTGFRKKRKKIQLLVKPILDASFSHEQ